MLVAASFLGSSLLMVESASADAACAGLVKDAPCKLDVDSKSYTPGTCDSSGTCIPTGTTMTTPTGVGGAGQMMDNTVPGTTTNNTGIITCGRPGQEMCTLCDLIKGMNTIIQYLMKLAIGVALLAMSIGGVMYIVSAGDSDLIKQAKSTMKNAAIGFVIIFAAFLIIDTTINYIGAKKNAAGASTFGMNIVSWGKFDCNARAR